MNVLILNQTFHPDTAATAQLMWDLAQYLDARGHRVSALSSRVFYGSNRLHDRAVETYGPHVTVHRVSGTRFGKNSRLGLFGRMSDFATFYATAAWKFLELQPPDVILALTSPPMIASLAVALNGINRFMGKRVPGIVCHVMDLYPEAAVASGVFKPHSVADRVLAAIAGRTMGAADAVIALGRDMKRRIVGRHRKLVDPARVHVVTPWADGRELTPTDNAHRGMAGASGEADAFRVVYSGNFGIAHDLDTISRAIDLTRDEQQFRWVFIGGGKRFETLRDRKQARGWNNVTIRPFQPRQDLNVTLNQADVHLISQLPNFTGVVVPSKLFGILAVGKPTVMVGPADSECAQIVLENQAGVVVRNGDSQGLVDALRDLRDHPEKRSAMGVRARAALDSTYSAELACSRIEAILQSVVDGNNGHL